MIEQLEADPEIEASRIGVMADNGAVTLAGHVASLAEKEKAEERVRRVEGVQAVANDLKVVVSAQYCCDDSSLAAAAVDILARHPLVPSERINISLSDGWMTITGEVDWTWQRREAEDALRSMIGLRGFTSSLVAKPRQAAPA